MNLQLNWLDNTAAVATRQKKSVVRQDRLVAALDVGSTKICCLVASAEEGGRIRVLGMGHRVSRGVRKGAVIDLEETEASIRAAVDQAERVARETVDGVIVNVSAGEPKSSIIEIDVAVAGHQVEKADIERVLKEAAGRIDPGEQEILHAYPACFAIDGAFGVKEPVGMYGDVLSTALHVVTVASGPLRNLETCVYRGHLDMGGMVVSPFASGLATLVEDEMELGAACVDMGGGTTTVSIFAGGAMVYTAVIPVGGVDITEDIARALLTPIDKAERLKTLHGSAVAVRADSQEAIDVLQLGENENDEGSYQRLPRSMLTGAIQPRIEEIFQGVRQCFRDSGFEGEGARRVVLTGGGSQLPGLRELAGRILGKQVRTGKPRGVYGLPESGMNPAFSTCVGLLIHGVRGPQELGSDRAGQAHGQEGEGLKRIGAWLKKNF